MKKYKDFLSNELVEAVQVSKIKKLNLVDDEQFGRFVLAMKKMDNDKPITKTEKDMIAKVFNKLISSIVSDPTLLQKIAKRDD
jgi:hypothetical protein